MTLEEALKLPAGRELDAVVAERVMGFAWVPASRGLWILQPPQRLEGMLPSCVRRNVPASEQTCQDDNNWILNYSTDIAAAWQVLEKVTKCLDELIPEDGPEQYGYWTLDRLGYDCCKDGKPDNDNAHGQYRVWLRCDISDDKDRHAIATGDTAPLSIVRAALTATWKTP